MIRKLLIPILILAAVAAYRSLVFVDEAETVIVTEFGDPIRTLNDTKQQAGLHFKLPYQSAVRIDRRLQIYDPRTSEFLAKEKKNVDLDVFVCWRVGSPRLFLETVSDFAGAEALLHDIVWSELAAEVGRNEVEALVSEDPALHRLDELVAGVTEACRRDAQTAYGIEIVDVRLKRIALPSQVRENVFDRMRAERARIAGQYRAEGEEKALEIRAEADKQYTVALAEADAEAEKTRGEAEAEAIRIYTEAHQKDPEFYELVRTLEAYEKFLDEKTTVLLSADSDLLKYLMRGSPHDPPTTTRQPDQ
ncbi:MAG: protease modulator HflC [Planctomycetes bacterium]|nr:protease modulator HflC [Planctomycetota bacterium]